MTPTYVPPTQEIFINKDITNTFKGYTAYAMNSLRLKDFRVTTIVIALPQ